MRPFYHLDKRDYDGKLDTFIDWKVVHACPNLRDFLCEVLNIAHVVMWNSMVLENIEPIVKFLFSDLPSPCLILDQEAGDELLNEKDVPVPKFGGRGGGLEVHAVGRRPPSGGVPHKC